MTSKKIAIIQSCYIPWKGYFDIINMVDEFILFDDVQYTKRDWRNRNLIKTPNGSMWLTIPVEVKGRYFQKIRDMKVSGNEWRKKHWRAISLNYAKSPYLREYYEFFEALYLKGKETFLSDINYVFLSSLNKLLNIDTKISWSSDYRLVEGKTERLVDLCKQAGATKYVSGPSARSYIDEKLFITHNIKLAWMDYSGYPEYQQLYSPFTHLVSIIDLIFNEGPRASQFMKSFFYKEGTVL